MPDLLVVTVDGYGKRTPLERYPRQRRGRRGVRTIAKGSKPLVAALIVRDDDELMIATRAGKIERLAVVDVARTGRATRGVRLVQLRPRVAVDDDGFPLKDKHGTPMFDPKLGLDESGRPIPDAVVAVALAPPRASPDVA